jgi:hypothetical protein
MGEETKIIPTIGRMVYFKSRGSADGVFPPTIFAAIITSVHEDVNYVDLITFGSFGLRFEPSVKNGDQIGEWDWMPYQKGQAKKTEELEKKLEETLDDLVEKTDEEVEQEIDEQQEATNEFMAEAKEEEINS